MSRPVAMFALERETLIDELFDPRDLDRLHDLVRVHPEVITAAKPLRAGSADEVEILLTGWGAPLLDSSALAALPRVRAAVHAAGTVKNLVSPALWERGIRVSSSAGANALPVAEYTLAMILLAAKKVLTSASIYRQTHDMASARPRGDAGAYGVTVGIVGASRIGRRVLELLRPFDVHAIVYDPSISRADAALLGADLVSLPELLSAADIVSLHAPSLPETFRMIGERELAAMRDGATLINTARGRLIDTDALVAALHSGRIEAVLDVTDPEPLPAGHALFSAPGVTLTPHIAGSLGNELRRMGRQVVDEVERFVTTGSLAFEVRHEDLATIA